MLKTRRNGAPDLLALAMRRARDDVAAGRVPQNPSVRKDGLSKPQTGKPIKTGQFIEKRSADYTTEKQ
ncbi:MAG: hypothetical protein OXF79_17290 [Chloroflexi bacterium]|nr:hypothetical protein [Chloroflexota bacterium]